MWLHIEGDNDTEAHIGWFDKDGLGGANTPSQFLGFRMIKKFPAHGSFDSQHDCLFLKEDADPALSSLILKTYGIEQEAALEPIH